jgi:hypothetical protein
LKAGGAHESLLPKKRSAKEILEPAAQIVLNNSDGDPPLALSLLYSDLERRFKNITGIMYW